MSPNAEGPQLIGALIERLTSVGIDADARELLDALWLAQRLPERAPQKTRRRRPRSQIAQSLAGAAVAAAAAPTSFLSSLLHSETDTPQPGAAIAPTPDNRTAPAPPDPSRQDAATQLVASLPTASAKRSLPSRLDLTRALRPLRRSFPSPRRWVLDETATAAASAETGFIQPIIRPDAERWFELAFVTDGAPSAVVWDEMVTTLGRQLAQIGIFWDVRQYTLEAEGGGGRLRSRSGRSILPGILLDPSGRRLLMLVTDGVGDGWRTGVVPAMLAVFGRRMPVIVLQLLPEGFWPRTDLGAPSSRAANRKPGAPNRALTLIQSWWDEPEQGAIGLPVTRPEPQSIGRWAIMAMGGNALVPAVVVAPGAKARAAQEDPDPHSQKRTAPSTGAELVRQFRQQASPGAFRLATCLAAVPLSLPAMRAMRLRLFATGNDDLIAEIVLGGLVSVERRPFRDNASSRPTGARVDDTVFAFRPGVASALLGHLSRQDYAIAIAVAQELLQASTGEPIPYSHLYQGNAERLPPAAAEFAAAARGAASRLNVPTPPVERAVAESSRQSVPRSLIVCFDAADSHGYPTNLQKIMWSVQGSDSNLALYKNSRADRIGLIQRFLGTYVAKYLIDAYRFLSDNYQPGDRIYLFGFSEGAYVARLLSIFIERFGLQRIDWFPKIDLASVLRLFLRPDSILRPPAGEPRPTFHPSIRFLGTWDTIRSLPFRFGAAAWPFDDTGKYWNIEHAYQALAIDEARFLYQPVIWRTPARTRNVPGPIIEQVWFPGSHGDVGGATPNSGIADLSLAWMIRKAMWCGLVFTRTLEEQLRPDPFALITDGRTVLEQILPRGARRIGEDVSELIHESALARQKAIPSYDPPNLAEALARRVPISAASSPDRGWAEQRGARVA